MSDETRGVPNVHIWRDGPDGKSVKVRGTWYEEAEARLLEDIVSVFRAVGPQRATGAQPLLDQLDALRKDHDV